MPKLTIALCQKKGPSMSGTQETTVALELEANSNLVSEPGKLRQRIRQLLAILRSALAEDLNGSTSSDSSQPEPANQLKNRWSVDRSATPSQVKAIYAITQAKRLNLVQILQDRFKVVRADKLSLRQPVDRRVEMHGRSIRDSRETP